MIWRYTTADLRPLPDFVILGAQRCGTTSLYRWLAAQPRVQPALKKEIHYFDVHYHQGPRWYRAHFPVRRPGRVTGEASPYMLFHPLAPARAAAQLPSSTRFIVVLRDPTDRAISHYWLSRQFANWESEALDTALALEPERLAPEAERVRHGERSFGHATYSYVARGEYAGQLRRWFDAVGRQRILVLESERLYSDGAEQRRVLDWLDLPPSDLAFPSDNQAERLEPDPPEVTASLRRHFEPHNRDLFELLGRELWTS